MPAAFRQDEIPVDLRKFFKPANCGECYVCKIVAVFREVRRVMRDDGTLWLNYGDTYANTSCGGESPDGLRAAHRTDKDRSDTMKRSRKDTYGDLKPGNLVGVPWRVVLALQADGWVWRDHICWHKPSPMPESVTNRCTKSWEPVFLLTKSNRYFCDMEAIREESKYTKTWLGEQFKNGDTTIHHKGVPHIVEEGGFKNKRSVWTVASQGYPGAHFATFPKKLIEPMILAGTSAKGACAKCGAPWRRVTKPSEATAIAQEEARNGEDWYQRAWDNSDKRSRDKAGNKEEGGYVSEYKTVGWVPTCTCCGEFVKRPGVRKGYGAYHSHKADGVGYGLRQDGSSASERNEPTKEFAATIIEYVPAIPLEDHPIRPCIILDPFIGSGTSAVVALEHGRRCWGIDLSEKYLLENAMPRVKAFFNARPAMQRMVTQEENVVSVVKRGRRVRGEGLVIARKIDRSDP